MSEWKPIKTAPKDGTKILADNPEWDSPQSVYFVRDEEEFWCYAETLLAEVCPEADPTSWMPLSRAPQATHRSAVNKTRRNEPG